MKIKVKLLVNDDESFIPQIVDKGEWIDLKAREDTFICRPQLSPLKRENNEAFRDVDVNFTLIPLGIAMKLPEGFEAVLAPRSSTFKNYGIIQANGIGIIDNSYSGNNDEWKFPAIALKDCCILKGDRICQFRIQLSQKATILQKLRWLFAQKIELEIVNDLGTDDRGGFGSSGRR